MDLDVVLILVMAAVGLAMGLVSSLIGVRARVEFIAWAVIYLLVAFMVELGDLDGFLSFLIGSTVGGLLTGLTQTVLLEHYTKHNPWYEGKMPTDRVAALKSLVPFGAVVGAVFGATVGGLVWGIFALLG